MQIRIPGSAKASSFTKCPTTATSSSSSSTSSTTSLSSTINEETSGTSSSTSDEESSSYSSIPTSPPSRTGARPGRPPRRILIIGGGFAGLAAARTLLQQQQALTGDDFYHVTVLEAKDRWGGRLHSVRLNDNDDSANNNIYGDLGGMFWHGDSTPVYQALARDFRHIDSIATGGDSQIPAQDGAMWLRYSAGGGGGGSSTTTTTTSSKTETKNRPQPVTNQEIRRSLEVYQAWESAMHQRYQRVVQLLDNRNKTQRGYHYDLKETETTQLLAQWSHDFCDTLSASDFDLLQLRLTMSFEMDRGVSWEQHSLSSLDQDWDWVDAVGDDVIARNGMREWVAAVVNDIQRLGGELLLNQRVAKIDHGNYSASASNKGRCIVTTEKGRVFRADHVVVALPLGVLKERANHLFYPPLPALKLDALDRAGVGIVNTLIVRWNRPLALPGSSNAYYFIQSKHQANPLRHGFCCPSHLRQSRHENTVTQFHFSETNHPFDDLEYWKAQAVQVVQDVVDEEEESLSTKDILVAHVSQWHLDPDIRGAYSAATTRTRGNADRRLLGTPVGHCLFFAGEHTHTGGRYQSLDGAYETGVRAAQEILHVLSGDATEREKAQPLFNETQVFGTLVTTGLV